MAIDISSQVAKADQAAAQRKYDMAIDFARSSTRR